MASISSPAAAAVVPSCPRPVAHLVQDAIDAVDDDALRQALRTLYGAAGFEPLWGDEGDARLAGGEVVAGRRGVVVRTAAREAAGPCASLAEDDVARTVRLLRTANALAGGQVARSEIGPYWRPAAAPLSEVAATARRLQEEGRLADLPAEVEPTHPQYHALARAFERYRAMVEAGGWPLLPRGATLAPGRRSPHVTTLRVRLAAEDEEVAHEGDVFDPELAAAVGRFQARHSLPVTRRVDAATRAALAVPADHRLASIRLNLERWRWLPRDLGRRHVLVNIPTFDLRLVEDGDERLAMKVITGRTETPTPVLSSEIRAVVFRPYWNVPPGILADELLPVLRRNPGELRRRNMEVVRGTRVLRAVRRGDLRGPVQVRQRPGPANALGLVKFTFPNPYNVYLHDTPTDGLFARARRAFSHGCVRVEKPEALADALLGWGEERVLSAMATGGERPVPLEDPVPVHITYFTAWADAEGGVRFAPDVYGHDASQGAALPAAGGAAATEVAAAR